MCLEDQSSFSSQAGENFSHLPVGVSLHGLSKLYGDRVAIQNLNISFYEGHVTTLLGPNGAGKTTTMYVGHSCRTFSLNQHVLRLKKKQKTFVYLYTVSIVF